MAEKTKNEKSIEVGITSAATLYCNGHADLELPIISSLANRSQGAKLHQLCGDLLIALGDYKMGLFEVKELQGDVLVAFNAEQHQQCVAYEDLGVPIEYAYGPANPHAGLSKTNPDSPQDVLEKIRRSTPKELPGRKPDTKHKTLLTWFEEIAGGGGGQTASASSSLTPWQILGGIQGAMSSCSLDFRNGALILLYSTEARRYESLTPDQLDEFVGMIKGEVQHLSIDGQKRLASLLKQSQLVQDAFRKLTNQPQPPAPPTTPAPSTDTDDTGESGRKTRKPGIKRKL